MFGGKEDKLEDVEFFSRQQRKELSTDDEFLFLNSVTLLLHNDEMLINIR
jgi:hypothetical protein